MKALRVLFQDLGINTLFIEAKLLPNYHVFQKIEPTIAKFFGSGIIVPFNELHYAIAVTETSYAELPTGSEFVLAARAKSPGGFLMPADILLKLETYAHYVDINRKAPERDVHIDGKERVFNLGPATFTFENRTLAHLNI